MLSDSHFTFKNNDILESDRFYTESICLTVAGLWRSLNFDPFPFFRTIFID